MEDLTFHLEGIVRSRDEMQDFSGPLSLILMLLSKNKIEIRDLNISEILEQYIEYIEKMQEMDLDVASEFVQMASHLVYIKTRTLLAGEEEVSEIEELMSSLEQLKCHDAYMSVKAITKELGELAENGLQMFSKQPEPLEAVSDKSYRYSHEPHELLSALTSVLMRGGSGSTTERSGILVPKRIIYGVREKCSQLIELLRSGGTRTMKELYLMSHSRSEVIATFISVLELCSMGSLEIREDDGELSVSLTGDIPDTLTELISDQERKYLMDNREIESTIEAILFAAGESVPASRIALVLGIDTDEVLRCAKLLADEYSFGQRGIRLVRMDESLQLCSAPEFSQSITYALERRKPPKLSQSALEVLAICAYFQPVTRAYVDQVRGVDSSYTMGILIERGLIEACGKLDVAGRPSIYKTSELFLRTMGITNLEELPKLPDINTNEGIAQLNSVIEALKAGDGEQMTIDGQDFGRKEVEPLKALIIVLLVLTVLMLIPLGIDGGFSGKKLALRVRVGLLNIRVFPRKKKLRIKKAGKAPKRQEEGLTGKAEKKKFDKEKLESLIKLGLKALGRFRRKLRIEFLRIRYTVATDDPFTTAMGYGAAGAAVSAIIPLVEDAFIIEERDFGASLDFLSGQSKIDFWITATIQVWEVFYIAAAFGIDWLKLKIRQKREERN